MQQMIELGIYHENPTIPPTVVVCEHDTDTFGTTLEDTITDLRSAAEAKLGTGVPDERVFIRIFKR